MKAKNLFVLILIVISMYGCGSAPVATEPPAPTNTVVPPTATEPPTATPVPATATPEFLQYFTEEFEGDLKYWPSFVVDGRQSVIAKEAIPEAILVPEAGGFLFDLQRTFLWAYATYDPFDYEDVRVDARVENQGANNNNVSLICRYSPESGWYEFNIANNGLFWIYHAKPREDGFVSYKILGEGGSNKIKAGMDFNEYAIICQGNTMTLFINGTETKVIQDSALSSGKVGVSISSFITLPVKVSFDWVKISEP
jgi:hypothetical protein